MSRLSLDGTFQFFNTFALEGNLEKSLFSLKDATTLVDLLFIELMLHLSHAKQMNRQQSIWQMNWYCAHKSQEERQILTEFWSEKSLLARSFWICDLPTQIFLPLQRYLPYRIRTF